MACDDHLFINQGVFETFENEMAKLREAVDGIPAADVLGKAELKQGRSREAMARRRDEGRQPRPGHGRQRSRRRARR